MREQFMRISMARLRSIYPFKPQRQAVAARMWVQYLERMREREREKLRQVRACAMHAEQQEWELMEEELNKRMDIIGQNGNTGEHYE
jgi:thioesterase domain-containing protein